MVVSLANLKILLEKLLSAIGMLNTTRNLTRKLRFLNRKANLIYKLKRWYIISKVYPNNYDKQCYYLTKKLGRRYFLMDTGIINKGLRHDPASKYFIIKGNWDTGKNIGKLTSDNQEENMDDVYGYIAVKQLFIDKIPYKECDQYKDMVQKIGSPYTKNYNCKSVNDVNRYFERLINAYMDIRESGYKTQAQLQETKNNSGDKDDEIAVYIDRYGRFLQATRGGVHRMAIAKILSVKQVPVILWGVHDEWAKHCFKKYKTDVLSSIYLYIDDVMKSLLSKIY